MKKQLQILLIEDNHALASQLVSFLEGIGWQVDYASSGKLGLKLAQQQPFDVVLLDLNLPDIDGLELCETLRATVDIQLPILMLTARDAYQDKALGFAAGTDDYMTKPFDLREMALRCEALARRRELFVRQSLEIGALKLCRRQRQVWWQGLPVSLTNTGVCILEKLMENHPYPSSRRELITHLWPQDEPESNVLKAHIYTLRKSLEPVIGYSIIHTISSIGYQLKDLGTTECSDSPENVNHVQVIR
ncbi:response regulator transcription factor [Alishewanella sp. d11]|uniref:response regulator transcription factor n=1 Tax=Alishewanella sp. d11 TaxID=3414030 RepID=UPI003BF85C40